MVRAKKHCAVTDSKISKLTGAGFGKEKSGRICGIGKKIAISEVFWQ